MSRWKAAAIHLSISATIGVLLAILIFLVWYPPPFFHAAGGDELIGLLVGVDLCIGPLLTLIVFRSGKPGLKFDLAVIGLAQAIALLYGISVMVQSRPIFLVGVLDRFVLVDANEITDADLAEGREPQFRSRSWTGPRLVATELPTDPKELSDLAFSALAGRDVQNLPKYYRDYDRFGPSLLAKAKPLSQLRKSKPKAIPEIDRWLRESGRDETSVVWLPVTALKSDMVMLIDAKSARPLKAIALDPW
jgi:hypothetical protein